MRKIVLLGTGMLAGYYLTVSFRWMMLLVVFGLGILLGFFSQGLI